MKHPEHARSWNWGTVVVIIITAVLVTVGGIVLFTRGTDTAATSANTDETTDSGPTTPMSSSGSTTTTTPEVSTSFPVASGAVPSPYLIPTTSGPVNPSPQPAYGVNLTPAPLPADFPGKTQIESSLKQVLEAYMLLGPDESPDDWQQRITALAPQLDSRSVQQYHDRLAGLYPLLQAQRQHYQVTVRGTVETNDQGNMNRLNALVDPGGVNMQVPVIVTSTKADGSLLDQPVELWSASYWVNQSGTWVVTSIYFGGGG